MIPDNMTNYIVNWCMSPDDLVNILNNRSDTSILFAKYTVLEYSHKTNELRVVKHMICPVDAKVDGDVINWRINDCDALCDPLSCQTDIKNDPYISNECLCYTVDSDTDNDDELEFTSIGIVTAIAVIDLWRLNPSYDVSINHGDTTVSVPAADNQGTANKITALLNKFIQNR